MPKCMFCDRPATVHVCDMSDGTARTQDLCSDHVPAEMRAGMPQTPADEAALLRDKLAMLDQSAMPAEMKIRARADLEQLILDIAAGRRPLSDLM